MTVEIGVGGKYQDLGGRIVTVVDEIDPTEPSYLSGWRFGCSADGEPHFNWTREGLYWPLGHGNYQADEQRNVDFEILQDQNAPLKEWF